MLNTVNKSSGPERAPGMASTKVDLIMLTSNSSSLMKLYINRGIMVLVVKYLIEYCSKESNALLLMDRNQPITLIILPTILCCSAGSKSPPIMPVLMLNIVLHLLLFYFIFPHNGQKMSGWSIIYITAFHR